MRPSHSVSPLTSCWSFLVIAATAHHYYPQKGEPNLAGPVTICKGPDSFAYWFAVLMNHLIGVLAFPPVFFEYIGAPYRVVRVAPPK